GAAGHLRAPEAGGALPRRLVRDQWRGRHPARPRARAWPHHRDPPLRQRHPLPDQTLQSRLPQEQEPAGAGLAPRISQVSALKGGGFYPLAPLGANLVIAGAIPLVREAIGRLPGGRGPLVFADRGPADGGTSRGLVAETIEAVRRRWP